VIISDDGYIVTNNHVIEDADEIEVTLNDNRAYSAELIGTDPSTDIALLKVNGEGLPVIPYGNSDELRLGEWVLAVGNPFNLTSTVTAGIVSAKGRNLGLLRDPNSSVAPLESFIQTDAAVNRGNSGGALVNAQGKLVGINTAIKSETGSYAGYSFAVPVNLVSKVVDDLLEFGAVQRAFIGVSIRDISDELAEENGLSTLSGVYVAGLMEDGAAEEAGIKSGDVIVRVGNVAVSDVPELQEQIGRFRPGNEVMVTVVRDGEEIEIPVVLTNRYGNTNIIEKKQVRLSVDLGATFKELGKGELKKLGIENGIQISELKGGKLRSSGIREGFIVTHVDKKPVGKFEDFIETLKDSEGGVLIEGIYPNGIKGYYGLGL
jgi:Do/DeqQ family serine protease